MAIANFRSNFQLIFRWPHWFTVALQHGIKLGSRVGRLHQLPNVFSRGIAMASRVYVVRELLLILIAKGQMPAVRIFLTHSINCGGVMRPRPIEGIISNVPGIISQKYPTYLMRIALG